MQVALAHAPYPQELRHNPEQGAAAQRILKQNMAWAPDVSRKRREANVVCPASGYFRLFGFLLLSGFPFLPPFLFVRIECRQLCRRKEKLDRQFSTTEAAALMPAAVNFPAARWTMQAHSGHP